MDEYPAEGVNFYDVNPGALRFVSVELRDSIGALAVAKLQATRNIAAMSDYELLSELGHIIADLQKTYDSNVSLHDLQMP